MVLTIALNLAPAVVLVGGWSLAVWRLHNGLGAPAAATTAPAARVLPQPGHQREAVLPASRAA